MNEWKGEHCQRCKRPYRMGYKVNDKIWYSVTEGKYNLLCLDCFDELAERKDVKYVAKYFWAGYGDLLKGKENENF